MSANPTPGSYAIWNPPSALFPIRYSLALFREIDFFVVDGYRRIPHGGLEVGAVLYGRGEPAGVTIHAYRPIECQHSFGPSFTLSTLDLEQLGKQVSTPLTTEGDEELEVVGWLISNCRSDLVLTEQEGRIYDEYFPGPRQVTLLAKPEKLKPTRYGFLAHPRRGGLLEKACRDPFILPLSAKGDATAVREVLEETSEIPAYVHPGVTAVPAVSAREVQPRTPPPPPPSPVVPASAPPTLAAPTPATAMPPDVVATLAPASAPYQEEPSALTHDVAEPEVFPSIPIAQPAPKPAEPEVREVPVPQPQASSRSFGPTAPAPPIPDVSAEPDSTSAKDSAAPLPASVASLEEGPPPPASVTESVASSEARVGAASADWPAEAIESGARSGPESAAERKAESLYPRSRSRSGLSLDLQSPASQPEEQEPNEQAPESRPTSASVTPWRELAFGVALLAVLAAAAIWTYLRLPGTTIALNAEVQPGQVVVTWPPELTKGADRCALTIWINGQATSQALSADEQSEGKAIIQTSGADVTIQLRAPYWYQERIGQIRVFRVVSPPPPSAPVPPKPTKRALAVPQGGGSPPPLTGKPADPPLQNPPQ